MRYADGAGDLAVLPARAAAPCPDAAPLRVLIVDDNRDFAEVLGILLRHLKMDVRVAFDAREALILGEHFRPDVILLELGLPELDGFQIAERLRGRQGTRKARLIALTAWARPEDRIRSARAGFHAHLLKPVSLRDLARFLV